MHTQFFKPGDIVKDNSNPDEFLYEVVAYDLADYWMVAIPYPEAPHTKPDNSLSILAGYYKLSHDVQPYIDNYGPNTSWRWLKQDSVTKYDGRAKIVRAALREDLASE